MKWYSIQKRWARLNGLVLNVVILGVTGCGPYSKEPVPNHNVYRDMARQYQSEGPKTPPVITEKVLVEKPVVVEREISRLDPTLIQVDLASTLVFEIGKTSVYRFQVRHFHEGLDSDLQILQSPTGLSLSKLSTSSEVATYQIDWSPAQNLLSVEKNYEIEHLKIKVQGKGADPKLSSLIKEVSVTLLITRSNVAPSRPRISNIPAQVEANSEIPFTVEVDLPGIGESPDLPKIFFYPDNQPHTPGVAPIYVADYMVSLASGNHTVRLNQNTWRFHCVLNTRFLRADVSRLPAQMRFIVHVLSPTNQMAAPVPVTFELVEARRSP